MTKNIFMAIALLKGLGMIFIGARFLFALQTAGAGYGIHFNGHGDYSFHYIKGIRDLFSGLLISTLVLCRQTKALGITLLIGTIIPVADLLIVLSKPYNGITQAIPHIIAIVICLFGGIYFLIKPKKQKTGNNNGGLIKIIQTGNTAKESIIEFSIVPGEKTPWHYHTLFSETFEVLDGVLELGRNKEVLQLKAGDIVTINPCEKHYFNNISNNECLLKVTISPGNTNFEHALLISMGLAKDGLGGASGTPKRISDLALFVYLNNSRMVGFQKIAEPIFNRIAKRAIQKGRLDELIQQYCKGTC